LGASAVGARVSAGPELRRTRDPRIAGLIPGGGRVARRSQTREAALPDPLFWIPVAMRERLKAGGESDVPVPR